MFNAVIEKWPLIYKRKPENGERPHQIPGMIAGTVGLLSNSINVAEEVEADGRPWLDANGKPILNSAGEPIRLIPGWKISAHLVIEISNCSAEAQRQNHRVTDLIKALGRFFPSDASPLKLLGDSVGPWLLYLAEKCVSGSAGIRHETQWMRFGWTSNGSLIQADNISIDWPIPAISQSFGDPPPERIEIADVIGASQAVLSDWITEIEAKGINQSSIIDPILVPAKYRFAVAFTFPGEKRQYVEMVDKALQKLILKDQIFYDNRHRHELAMIDLDDRFGCLSSKNLP